MSVNQSITEWKCVIKSTDWWLKSLEGTCNWSTYWQLECSQFSDCWITHFFFTKINMAVLVSFINRLWEKIRLEIEVTITQSDEFGYICKTLQFTLLHTEIIFLTADKNLIIYIWCILFRVYIYICNFHKHILIMKVWDLSQIF